MGQRVITTRRPASDGTPLQFNPETAGASHFSRLNEATPNASNYVQSNVSGNRDLYGYAALGFNPTTITSVNLKTLISNPGPTTINFKNGCKSGAVTSDGPATPCVNALTVQQQPYDQNPNGSVPWTQATLDAAQFGVSVA